jgi:LacI family transcriptional regulator
MSSITINELAKRLNISKSTVSRALADSYEISKDTKQKVKALAKELNYQPNLYASSLRKHKSKTIAIIVPEVANNFFALVINGVESVAREKGYHVLVYITHDEHEREVAICNLLKSGRIDGMLLSVTSKKEEHEHLSELQKADVKIIFFDRILEDFNTLKIKTDDTESSIKATEHLIKKGCKRIACLSVLKDFSIGDKRLLGYTLALEKNKIAVDQKLIIRGGTNYIENKKLIKNLLNSKKRPDGVFALVEKMATTCYEAAFELGIKIPEELKVIGFSNLEIAGLLNPSLTTITQPAFEIGKRASTLLINSIEKKSAQLYNEIIIMPSELVERKSTAY